MRVVGKEGSLRAGGVKIAAVAWTALKRYGGDIQGVEVFITLADFDIRWDV